MGRRCCGMGVLDPDALCPLTPCRRDGSAVRLESHRVSGVLPISAGRQVKWCICMGHGAMGLNDIESLGFHCVTVHIVLCTLCYTGTCLNPMFSGLRAPLAAGSLALGYPEATLTRLPLFSTAPAVTNPRSTLRSTSSLPRCPATPTRGGAGG